jgi:hypothetical protein
LFGWVWWPVEWQGSNAAAPAAAPSSAAVSQFDTPEARYLYLGATADAFALSTAAGDGNAASLAAQRLAALGGDIRSAFDGAIDFYTRQANGSTQVRNLTTLAGAVGIPLGTAAAAGGEADQGAAQSPAATTPLETGAETAQTAAAAPSDGGNPLGWLLSLLVALLLIGGGLYLLWSLNQRRTLDLDDTPSGFVDEEITASPTTAGVSSFDRSGLSPVRTTVQPAASVRSTVERPVAVQGQDPHGFDADDDEFDDEFDGEGTYTAYERRTTETVVDVEPDETYDDRGDLRDDEDEWVQDEESSGAQDPDESSDAAPARTNVPGTAVRTAPPPTLQPPTPSRYDRSVPLGSYTATYYAGQVDFDQAKSVSNPDGEGYLGEYSVGIPQKNGLLDHDLEKALAVEVMLFDKALDREMVTVTRLLLSEYAHNRLYEEYQRANPKLAPIVAQPNTNFQLEGKQLLLDCFIREVRYTREGFFQNLTLDLTVKRKV